VLYSTDFVAGLAVVHKFELNVTVYSIVALHAGLLQIGVQFN
jgi:hypothetical protein